MTTTDTPTEHAGAAPTTQSSRLLAWCVAASFGVLFIKSNSLLEVSAARPRTPLPITAGFADYVPLLAPALALVLWSVLPRRSWPWMLLAGAVCSALLPLATVNPGTFPGYSPLLTIVIGAAPTFVLIGVLGGATWLWHAGRRSAGVALVGAAVVVQLVGPVVIASALIEAPVFYRVFCIVLAIVAIVGAIGATIVANRATPRVAVRPGWRVTVAAAVAAASAGLPLVWQVDPYSLSTDDVTPLADYYLNLGLVFLAIGLVTGAVAGGWPLLCALTAGLMLGAFGMLIQPSVEVLHEMATIALVAAAGSLLLGWAAALSRWRTWIGAGGLAVLVIGLLVIFAVFNGDDPPNGGNGFTRGLTPVLLVIGVVAAVAAMAAVGSVLAPRLETPAVLAGLTTPFALGAITVIAHFTITKPDGKAPIVGLLPAVVGALLISAAGLVALANRRRAGHGGASVMTAASRAPW